MEMEEFVKMLKAISDNREVLIPAQIHLRGQISDVIDSLGGTVTAYEYFKKVHDAEAPTYSEEK